MPTLSEFLHASATQYLKDLLAACNGNVIKAAKLAGRNRSEFYRVLKRYSLTPKDFRAAKQPGA